jgi:hypothetical protein
MVMAYAGGGVSDHQDRASGKSRSQVIAQASAKKE